MADVVNLNRVRKAKAKADKAKRAEENRIRFGRTKAEKARDADARNRHERALGFHQIENSKDTEKSDN